MTTRPTELIGVEPDMEFGGAGPPPDFEVLMCSPRIAHWEWMADERPDGGPWWGAKVWLKPQP
jgi:hypothetical protein